MICCCRIHRQHTSPLFPYTTLFRSILDPSGKYTFIGEKPFEVTNWDPALTQKVLSADIAKYSKIDVIVSDSTFCVRVGSRSDEHTSELESRFDIVCRLLLATKKLTI